MYYKKNNLIKIFVFSVLIAIPSALFAQTSDAMVNLTDEAQKLGMTFFYDPMTQNGILEQNGHTICFRSDSSLVLKDYKYIMQEDLPEIKNGVLYVTQSFINSAQSFFQSQNDSNPFRVGAILIDPGHGGKDPGASATHKIKGRNVTVQEKDINLKVGKYIYNLLKTAYPDKKILMTRSTDTFISLSKRTEIANSVQLEENEAIIYISIHVNASLDSKASGYEAWYLSPGYRRQVLGDDVIEDESVLSILNSMMEEEYTTESILIANFIMSGISAQVGNLSASRGIKAEEWFVVRNANMPSVLVETGFLTNPTEGALLADDSYLQKLSFGIYNGLQAFVTHFERSRGFTQND